MFYTDNKNKHYSAFWAALRLTIGKMHLHPTKINITNMNGEPSDWDNLQRIIITVAFAFKPVFLRLFITSYSFH